MQGTYKSGAELAHGEAVLCEFDGWREDLLQRELAASELLDRIDPAGGSTRYRDRQRA